MMFSLNMDSWSSMKLTCTGSTYMLRRTSSLSPSAAVSRVASFSVVMMQRGCGSASKASLMRRTSLGRNVWWSGKERGERFESCCRSSWSWRGEAMPVSNRVW